MLTPAAIHEAGHLCMARLKGFPARDTALEATAGRDHIKFGRCKPADAALVAAAGAAAEWLIIGRATGHYEGMLFAARARGEDPARAREWFFALIREAAALLDEEEVLEVARGLQGEEEICE